MVKDIIGGRVESDNEYYCKCCDKIITLKYVNKHEKTKRHQSKELEYKQDTFKKQIIQRFIEDFNNGYYNPNNIKLSDKECRRWFEKIQKHESDKFYSAWIDGYFNDFELDEEIDFIKYMYHELGIELNP